MRLRQSLKSTKYAFLIITFITIIFKPKKTSVQDLRDTGKLDALFLVAKEAFEILSIALLPTIIIFLVFYFFINKTSV